MSQVEYTNTSNQSFWTAKVSLRKLLIHSGKIGSEGKLETHEYKSNAIANLEMYKAMLLKRDNGYSTPNAINMEALGEFETTPLTNIDKSSYSALEHKASDYGNFIYITEDIVLEELNLIDLAEDIRGVIINADLKVDGGIISGNVPLIVTGDVQADYIIAHGSEVYLKGKATFHTFAVNMHEYDTLAIRKIRSPIVFRGSYGNLDGNILYKFLVFSCGQNEASEKDLNAIKEALGDQFNLITTELMEYDEEDAEATGEKYYNIYSIDVDYLTEQLDDDKKRLALYSALIHRL